MGALASGQIAAGCGAPDAEGADGYGWKGGTQKTKEHPHPTLVHSPNPGRKSKKEQKMPKRREARKEQERKQTKEGRQKPVDEEEEAQAPRKENQEESEKAQDPHQTTPKEAAERT